jgi:hypothetical protein
VKVEGRLVPDQARWQAFSKESAIARFSWLVSASLSRLPRESLRDRAQVFLDFFASLGDGERYSADMVTRLALIVSEKSGRQVVGRANGRFSMMLREQEASSAESGGERSLFVPVARAFGLLVDEDGLLVKNSAVDSSDKSSTNQSSSAAQKALVVSPSLDVTVMPGLDLEALLPLALCMEVRDVQIAGQFALTRKSCAAAFDQGQTGEIIVSLLRSRSSAPLPQNVEFSVNDWFRSYSSVSLYHGFILRVDESRRVLFENDEYLSSLIRKILAPGIYLLDADSPEEIQSLFADADLDFLPSVNSPLPKRESAAFPVLRGPVALKPPSAVDPAVRDSSYGFSVHGFSARASAERVRSDMLRALDSLAFPGEIDEALRSRIERKIALSPAQLDPDSVRVEKLEARGMDFLGKIRIAEYALATGSLLEIVLDEKDGTRSILGRPVTTEKRTGDVLLRLSLEPEGSIETVSLGKAILVRRIRGSIFSELPI